jgi:GTP-binding protein
MDFLNFLGEHNIPFVIAYTKIDKVRKTLRESNVQAIQDALLESWEFLPQQFVTSATTGEGREDILTFIEEINNN